MELLYHVSDHGGIDRFEPRPPPTAGQGVAVDCVWAIDAAHIVNYLLPRECPRVTFYPVDSTSDQDLKMLGGPFPPARHVVAIEDIWFQRAMEEEVWIYSLPATTFQALDAGAGYHVSEEAVVPLERRKLTSPLNELVRRGVELRVLPSLWPLRDAVVRSTVQFSIIRMRNAKPRMEEAWV